MLTIEIGTGVLNWSRAERVSDRYGSVRLYENPEEESVVSLNRAAHGHSGTLVALVKETRKSYHIGDLHRRIFPKTPKVGERIVLGTGRIEIKTDDVGDENVYLIPEPARDKDWMDPRQLYRAHSQTVTLTLEKPEMKGEKT